MFANIQKSVCSSLLLLVLLPMIARAQGVPTPFPPGRGPAPLLYVRFLGPPGLHVTFYQGAAQGRDYPAPVAVGLRPGYVYRVRISGLPGLPEVFLSPTLEVRGSLCLAPHIAPADYPAPVVFTDQDVSAVLNGAMLTKVVYLEHPDLAVGTGPRQDGPLEFTVPADRDLLADARGLGRPMLVIRLGQRDVPPEELARCSVPDTILFPGQRALPPPRVGPPLTWTCGPAYDPFWGPRPLEEECLHDGGDVGLPAGIDGQGRLQGVDPSDAVAEYGDSHGRRRVVCSNRVCLCVPRFAALRSELPLAAFDTSVGPVAALKIHEQEQLQLRVPSREAHQYEQLKALQGRKRPTAAVATEGVLPLLRLEVLAAEVLDVGPVAALCLKPVQQLTEVERARFTRQMELARQLNEVKHLAGVEQVQVTAVVGRVEGLDVVSAQAETRDLTVCCNEAPHAPEKPLVLYKWADAQAAQVGDTVTFYLKYTNHGGRPITDVAVVDSLTGRLEYVAGSAKSNRAAVFTMQQNEAGSLLLRWEVSGRLLPGDSGVVSFQARIR